MNKLPIKEIYSVQNNENILIVLDLFDENGNYKIDLSSLQNCFNRLYDDLYSKGYKGTIAMVPNIGMLETFDKNSLISIRDSINNLIEAL